MRPENMRRFVEVELVAGQGQEEEGGVWSEIVLWGGSQ